ncbi:hypothetical protein QJS04_geneDACA009439 [Acorus gramineus]|uniref:Uncharacterized protein n=1 Tax=Acorus gramineus TaxID=55184 RepID=A0AAV9AG65_ACOGR|nr:hypothetical protein QJS04_geneDACA009439 [Acorus gramineus]
MELEELYLGSNGIAGWVDPQGFRDMQKLEMLNLSNNPIKRVDPWISNITSLQNLDLSSNMIKEFPSDLSNNNLLGTIPSCLNNITFWIRPPPSDDQFPYYYDLINVTEIAVTTDLITKGRLYNFMGDPLSLMTQIDLSMNMLSGPIPMEMGYLRTLHSLNLSHNNLTGSIPESFQNLMSLESLDLSFNHLSSEIPPQLAQLNALSTFRVAYNNLSGIIPLNGQFSTFNASDFEGNPNLCGPLVERSCSSGTSQTHRITNDEVDKPRVIDSPVIYYSFIAASYAIGFWGVIVVLAFKENWRVKFFLATDDLIYACESGISGLARCIRKCVGK